jgi:hypothetical protein
LGFACDFAGKAAKYVAIMRSEGPMAKNRFEQVDDVQPDALNLMIAQKSDGQIGVIHVPRTAKPGELPVDLTTEEMPVQDAVIGAIQLANSKKLPIVVIDRDNIWKSEWGDLWRYEDEAEEESEGGS